MPDGALLLSRRTVDDQRNRNLSLWLQGRAAVIAAAHESHWRDAAHDYHLSHEAMPSQRTFRFSPEQVETVVDQIVQVFETEVSHKTDPATWVSMVEDFRTRVNGGRWYSSAEIAEQGSDNLLIGDSAFYRRTTRASPPATGETIEMFGMSVGEGRR